MRQNLSGMNPPDTTMKDSMAGCFLMALSVLFGAPLAFVGATAAGLPIREQEFGLEPLLYPVIGAVVAPVAFLILLAVLSCRKSGSASSGGVFAGALALAFLSGFVGFRISKYNERANIGQHKEQAAESGRKQDEFHALLRKDPGLAIRERWYLAEDERQEAYRYSLWLKDVPYSPENLASLYAVTDDGMFPDSLMAHILAHPAFSPEVLRKEYRRAILELLDTGECWRLRAIIESPKFEQAWLEELDETGLLDREEIRCAGSVREAIAKRFPDR